AAHDSRTCVPADCSPAHYCLLLAIRNLLPRPSPAHHLDFAPHLRPIAGSSAAPASPPDAMRKYVRLLFVSTPEQARSTERDARRSRRRLRPNRADWIPSSPP